MDINTTLINFERAIFLQISTLRQQGVPPVLIDGALAKVSASLRYDITLSMQAEINQLTGELKKASEKHEQEGLERSENDPILCAETGDES